MKSLSILLVDDDRIERLKFRKVCQKLNSYCTVLEAVNGEEAFALLNDKNNSFDLIITDINMPKMDGFEFLSAIKSNSKLKPIPVVIMSTSESKIDLEKGYDIGISGYFSKPLKFADYTNKVTSLLEYWNRASLSNS
ncbi:response regulator [Polaribacter vadi]|uniref:response regulator n=1 Tax=Polaribacter TaxID=52959 RepID=UPI001C09575A|nr:MULTISPECIES: response regulator [Polaribacter]MBU3011551.1 response regulator [Polaribacter vadi]MDO6741364.1 response regulator [Polaribacter sp. 1_MG-2023]